VLVLNLGLPVALTGSLAYHRYFYASAYAHWQLFQFVRLYWLFTLITTIIIGTIGS